MKAGWTEVLLEEVSEINPTDGRPEVDTPVTFVPMAALDERYGRCVSEETRPFAEVASGYTQFRRGDLLVAKITPCFENGKIGAATIENELGVGSTEFHVVRPVSGVLNSAYALHFLRRKEVRQQGELRMTGSAGQRRVPAAFLKKLPIPLPPLDEQERIARLLGLADGVRARRTVTFRLLEEVRTATFSSAVAASNGSWPLVPVADLVDKSNGGIRTGPFGSQLLHSEFVDEGVAVLGIDNAVANRFRWGVERHITEAKYAQLRRYTVHPGDVLITIMGTCGRAAVVPDEIGRVINTKHLCCITLDRLRCLPEFLHAYFLRHPIARQYLASRVKGAIMAGLNMTIIKELPVSLPPLDVQAELVDRLAAIDAAEDEATLHREHLGTLFESLQYRAFIGEL